MERLKNAMLVNMLPIYREQKISTFDKETFYDAVKTCVRISMDKFNLSYTLIGQPQNV